MSTFNFFAYGTLMEPPAGTPLLAGCSVVGPAHVYGILYDIDGRFPAAVLYGGEPIHGIVWRCPAERLAVLDEYEGLETGLFRRVALEVDMEDGRTLPCWLYAAGPALSRKLLPERRIAGGRFNTEGSR